MKLGILDRFKKPEQKSQQVEKHEIGDCFLPRQYKTEKAIPHLFEIRGMWYAVENRKALISLEFREKTVRVEFRGFCVRDPLRRRAYEKAICRIATLRHNHWWKQTPVAAIIETDSSYHHSRRVPVTAYKRNPNLDQEINRPMVIA